MRAFIKMAWTTFWFLLLIPLAWSRWGPGAYDWVFDVTCMLFGHGPRCPISGFCLDCLAHRKDGPDDG